MDKWKAKLAQGTADPLVFLDESAANELNENMSGCHYSSVPIPANKACRTIVYSSSVYCRWVYYMGDYARFIYDGDV